MCHCLSAHVLQRALRKNSGTKQREHVFQLRNFFCANCRLYKEFRAEDLRPNFQLHRFLVLQFFLGARAQMWPRLPHC
jgi:hypothetical protein